VWGPEELFYGELYASRRVPCKPTLARPGTRDTYSACVGRELVREDLYDFLLFSLPDNDHHTHTHGVDGMTDSIAHADRSFGEIVDEAGGIDAFLDGHAVILMADHAQTDVERTVPIVEALGDGWDVATANAERAGPAELAVSPTARAAAVYVLPEDERHAAVHGAVRERLRSLEGVDLLAWLSPESAADPEAVVASRRGELRFRPGRQSSDRRGAGWDLEGDPGVLGVGTRDGLLDSPSYPDGLGRIWAALRAPNAGDLLVSLEQGYECVDWGGVTHVGGASHGALLAGDSLGPLVLCGFAPGVEDTHDQWALRDVAGLVLEHFEVEAPDSAGGAEAALPAAGVGAGP
jgi:hypothetical protein